MIAVSSTGRRLAALGLIVAMAVGSVVMWLGIPIGLLYVASRLQGASGDPSMGIYLGLAVLIPAGMFAMARLLWRFDRRYGELTGAAEHRPVQANWLRSMRAERGSLHRTSILDVVMVGSVAVAVLVLAVWFFAFAGSSLPS
jgi:hypothetical protein